MSDECRECPTSTGIQIQHGPGTFLEMIRGSYIQIRTYINASFSEKYQIICKVSQVTNM